jgi:4-oxalocrotonate tautomerase
MPVITIDGPPIKDLDKRRQLVSKLTESAANAYSMPKEKIIILIRENSPDQVAVAGELISDR